MHSHTRTHAHTHPDEFYAWLIEHREISRDTISAKQERELFKAYVEVGVVCGVVCGVQYEV
jgi:hypothetical protein